MAAHVPRFDEDSISQRVSLPTFGFLHFFPGTRSEVNFPMWLGLVVRQTLRPWPPPILSGSFAGFVIILFFLNSGISLSTVCHDYWFFSKPSFFLSSLGGQCGIFWVLRGSVTFPSLLIFASATLRLLPGPPQCLSAPTLRFFKLFSSCRAVAGNSEPLARAVCKLFILIFSCGIQHPFPRLAFFPEAVPPPIAHVATGCCSPLALDCAVASVSVGF